MSDFTPWPSQLRALELIDSTIAAGVRRMALTSPTGGGKTWIVQEGVRRSLARKERSVLYSNRKALIEQTSRSFESAGFFHGVRAAGHEDLRELPFQIASLQTEHARAMKRKTMRLHDAQWVWVDEAHLQANPSSRAILKEHLDAGAVIIGVTATPLGLADDYEELLIAGTKKELRECGALVWAYHYAPDEPDWKDFKKAAPGLFVSEKESAKAMAPKRIFGRVWEHFQVLNPNREPFILFGPGVEESLWYAERFSKEGVRTAHIDGDDIWVDGEFHAATPELREELLKESKQGKLIGICNRFVMREGINAPWIRQLVLATIFGSLQSYLQSVGRGLRADSGKEHLIIQDHAGNWWRHCSANEDIEWQLAWTPEIAHNLRIDRIRDKKQPEPFRCPKCDRVWVGARTCNPALGGCGYVLEHVKRSRPVIASDGSLREMHGAIFRPRRIMADSRGPKIWERMYWRSRSAKGRKTFRSAMALFAQENKWGWPDKSWPLMPVDEMDFHRLVEEVPMSRLTSVPVKASEPDLYQPQE